MPLVLHKESEDGTIEHSEFSQGSWEAALREESVYRRWAHPPGECYDIVAKHWADLRKRGWRCTPSQHAWADKFDPEWKGSRQLEQFTKTPPTAAEPISWPPTTELTPWMLQQLTPLGHDDCKEVLSRPKKELPRQEPRPLANKKGQYSLF